jgi:hypothetical protein
MSFATATIQGYVTWISDLKQTPSGRNVVNLMVAVPDKTKTKSTTYKLSVWDAQTGSVLRYLKVRQLVTAQGTLGLETFGDNPMIRLDFASILNFGYIADTDEVNEEDRSIKTKTGFIPLDLENIKTQVTKVKEKVTAKVT